MSKPYSKQYEDVVDMLCKLTNDPDFVGKVSNDVLNISILGVIGELLAHICDEVRALRKIIEEKE